MAQAASTGRHPLGHGFKTSSRIQSWDRRFLKEEPRAVGWPQGILVVGLLALALPALTGLTSWTAPLTTASCALAIWAWLVPFSGRSAAFRLFALALGLRLLVLIICYAVRARYGIETVNPDATYFLAWAREIAQELPLAPDIRPYYRAATYDVGFHYLAGWEIWIFGDDVLTLLSFNAMAGAAAVLLMHGLLMRSEPGLRILPAYVAALHPGLLYSSSGDLLKDPWVLLATLAGLLLALRALRERPTFAVFCSLAAGLCFFFLRVTRLYALFVCLFCLAAAGLYGFLRHRPHRVSWPSIARWAILAAGIAVGLELPASLTRHPTVLAQSLGYLQMVREQPRVFVAPEGRVAARLTRREGKGRASLSKRIPGATEESFEEKFEELREQKSVRLGILQIAADLIRKVYGPYLWVAPPSVPFSLIEGSFWDYLSMIIWYPLLPLSILAIFEAVVRKPDPLGAVAAVGASITLTLLVVFSLSYRQRSSVTVPFLLLVTGLFLPAIPPRAVKTVLRAQTLVILGLASAYYILLR